MHVTLRALLLPLAVCSLVSAANAQSLVPGTWSGAVTVPGGQSKSMRYTVARTGDSLSVTVMEAATGTPAPPFTHLRQTGDTLIFNWAGGRQRAQLTCELVRQPDGAYEGNCEDDAHRTGRMRMVPPKKQ